MCDCFACRLERVYEGIEVEEIQTRVEKEDYLKDYQKQLEDQQELYDPFADQTEVCGVEW
jgi:hypothetical protein